MQKFIPIVVVVLVSVALWFAITSRGKRSEPIQALNSVASSSLGSSMSTGSGGTGSGGTGTTDVSINTKPGDPLKATTTSDESSSDDEAGSDDFDDRPATERYTSAEQALKAIKDAAVDYDDLVLDQFTNLGENCPWCDGVYSSVKDLLNNPETKQDQKSFYAEILAVSGRVDNLKTIVDGIKNSKSQDDIDTYSEALELAVGKDEVTKFLGEQLADSNATLREASVAALTNQGSRSAVETLYNHTVSQGDADGYYSKGIGVGEVVPEEDAWPFLQQKASAKDAYSHLAVKSLLNVGLEGVKMVADIFGNSDDPEYAKKVLTESKDHVAFDDETVEYLRSQVGTTKSPVLAEYYKMLLNEYEQSEQEMTDTGDEGGDSSEDQLFTPNKPTP